MHTPSSVELVIQICVDFSIGIVRVAGGTACAVNYSF